jgi:hypothetical protein
MIGVGLGRKNHAFTDAIGIVKPFDIITDFNGSGQQ